MIAVRDMGHDIAVITFQGIASLSEDCKGDRLIPARFCHGNQRD